jgi:hypothetical protein
MSQTSEVTAGSPENRLVVLSESTATHPPIGFNPLRKKLFYYKISVGIKVETSTSMKISRVQTYLVGAPSQCSALKHTALLPEVMEILNVVGQSDFLTDAERVTLKLETDQECPPT